MKHIVFCKSNRPIIAIPVDAGLKVAFAGIGCLPSYSFHRKIYKLMMVAVIIFYFLFPFKNKKISNFLVDWFESNESLKDFHPVFIWSLVEGRMRYYSHLLNKKGEKIYFAKITTNKNHFNLLETEKYYLDHFSKAKTFSVPRVINFTRSTSYASLITNHITKDFSLCHPQKSYFPNKISKEISGTEREYPLKDIIDNKKIVELTPLNKFIMNENTSSLIRVSRSHGDLGSENIFKNSKNEYLIIDWETAKEDSPYLVDKIGFWLGKNHRCIKKNQKKSYIKFIEDFKQYEKIDLACGLYFLNEANFDLAILISNNWEI